MRVTLFGITNFVILLPNALAPIYSNPSGKIISVTSVVVNAPSPM